jgi:DNA helicase-2/ATP-dependent DNA helicase PcrA
MPRDYELTEEQLTAINSNENMVITACPGSGKTTVIVEKIRKELNELPSYQGVIGITFTQKSAKELKNRCKKDSFDIKSTFLGTIDHFCLQEIIYPFISRLYGISNSTLECKSYKDIEPVFKEGLPDLNENGVVLKTSDYIGLEDIFINHYNNGFILLEAVGIIASNLTKNSISCQRYLKARYTTLYIDEYQDSSEVQHKLFLNIYELGLKAVAVGDINQSIYAWRGSNPEYIQELISRSDVFEHHIVNINHRCHISISNYANRLLDENCQIISCDDLRVYQCQMNGTQVNVAEKLNIFIPQIMNEYEVECYSNIAILVKNNNSLEYLKENIILPYKVFDDDILLLINTSVSKLLYELLVYRLNENILINDVLESLRSYDFSNKSKLKNDRNKIQRIRTYSNRRLKTKLISLVSQLLNETPTDREIEVLDKILASEELLNKYNFQENNELQIMTLHKSKGLEFEVVIHLDLYEWILPKRNYTGNWDDPPEYPNYRQDLNLHYVGVTRAKSVCYLIYSSRRLNSNNENKSGQPSYFLQKNGLNGLFQNLNV